MKQLLRKLLKALAYSGAALLIALAIAVGIFRLMLPRLPEYQEEIKGWASEAIGMDVEFTDMNARWRLSGPEVSFFDASLSHRDTGISVANAEEVSIGVGLLRLVVDREVVVDRVTIRESAIDLRQDGNGNWIVQGIPLDELIGDREFAAKPGGDIRLIGQNLAVEYEHPASGQLVPFTVSSLIVSGSDAGLGIDASIDLDREFGERLNIQADRPVGGDAEDTWRLYVEAESLDLPGWSRLQQFALPNITSGTADFVLWIDLVAGTVTSATANIVLSELHAEAESAVPPIGLQGSFEYSTEVDGWLLGASQLRVDTVNGDWPLSSLRLRIQTGDDGVIQGLRGGASYFDLSDLRYIRAWLPEDRRETLDELGLSGVMRDLSFDLDELDGDRPNFNVSAEFEGAGIAAAENRPGLREFSGRVRADRDGGRVELDATNLQIDLGDTLPDPLTIDDAYGTVIWRRNAEGMIVLSDSVQIRNADFDSQLSLQVSVPSGDASPVIDLDGSWSVLDVSAVRRYLPVTLINPKLRDWLSNALVSGYVRYGTVRFDGALADFPFDDGSGVFRIDARLEDTVLQYAPDWPAPEFRHLDVVVENTRLFTEENYADNLGNVVNDARVEIPDLRAPVLYIDTFATGTLQTIKDFAAQSPIAGVFGGQLDRIDVEGAASFDLEITLPLQSVQDYEFATRIRTSDGVVRVRGFEPPITGLNGAVTITRSDISSESLFGTFLGNPVELELTRIGGPDAPHSAVLHGSGRTTAQALQDELQAPLGGAVEGEATYEATIRFPNGRSPEPGPLQISIASDLYGFRSNLPAPFGKSVEEARDLAVTIEFPSPNQIATAGSLAGDVNWTARFLKQGDAWDFDRGVVAIGEYPRAASVRGLHIHGQLARLDLREWLAEGRRGNREVGLGERIRTIELGIDNLYAVGQRFTNQHVTIDRSGLDWVIRMSGREAEGIITVPYDFTGERPMTLDMDWLTLPGDEESATETAASPLDPRTLPALSIRAAEFALGERHFGRLDAEFERSPRGLVSTTLETRDDSFIVSGAAGWVIDAYEESGQRTWIDAVLRSTDVQATAQQLQYDPGIVSDSMEVRLNVGWPGGPRRDFMGGLNGEVGVRIGAGRLAEVDPGAGRMFGLMSVTALPRRLSLDFSDVFETGFGYDEIVGDFRLVSGDAFTCNLTLTGPAADVGIVGRAGLVSRDYDQAAIVSANVGGTLPVAGLFLGGPQVAAALLVFSQLFKKPLKDMGQVFYTVAGPWDEPNVESADSQTFADISNRAGCLDES
jgi:uncharacterized protein (TIGR02099 family)